MGRTSAGRTSSRIVATALAIAALSACAGLDTRLPEISAPALASERTFQQGEALAEQARLRARLVRVADAVRVANAALCPRTRLGIGVSTHALDDYPKSLREAAAREFGAAEEPRIDVVVPGSPADDAGLLPGDALLVDGAAVSARSKRFRTTLNTGKMSVRRNGVVRVFDIAPRQECDYGVSLSQTADINAYANGRSITMTRGMMNFVGSDDELALILGHEMAHNTMGHVRKMVGNFILSLGGTRYTRPFESEADYVGLYYLVRAGFDPDGVEDVWRRLGTQSPRATSRAKTHPTTSQRFLAIEAARAEIEAKRAAGEPLVPNFKADS